MPAASQGAAAAVCVAPRPVAPRSVAMPAQTVARTAVGSAAGVQPQGGAGAVGGSSAAHAATVVSALEGALHYPAAAPGVSSRGAAGAVQVHDPAGPGGVFLLRPPALPHSVSAGPRVTGLQDGAAATEKGSLPGLSALLEDARVQAVTLQEAGRAHSVAQEWELEKVWQAADWQSDCLSQATWLAADVLRDDKRPPRVLFPGSVHRVDPLAHRGAQDVCGGLAGR